MSGGGISKEKPPGDITPSQPDVEDEVLRSLALSLILRESDGAIKTPVITLATEKTCIYSILERHLKPEALPGADKWWRICKTVHQPPLEVARPILFHPLSIEYCCRYRTTMDANLACLTNSMHMEVRETDVTSYSHASFR